MIQVVNKYKHKPTPNDIYIGRGSPFGNKYVFTESKFPDTIRVKNREEAIQKYEEHFGWAVCNEPVVYALFSTLVDRELREEDTFLVCYCHPNACHGDVIKKMVDEKVFWMKRNE
jgi:hypothetical protein